MNKGSPRVAGIVMDEKQSITDENSKVTFYNLSLVKLFFLPISFHTSRM